jgi:heme/copper-type cytochrome/quinol oxidase subunit 4
VRGHAAGRTLRAAVVPIAFAVALTLLAVLILVHAGFPQLGAIIARIVLPARIVVSAAVALAAFAELVPHIAGAAQCVAVLREGDGRQTDQQNEQ